MSWFGGGAGRADEPARSSAGYRDPPQRVPVPGSSVGLPSRPGQRGPSSLGYDQRYEPDLPPRQPQPRGGQPAYGQPPSRAPPPGAYGQGSLGVTNCPDNAAALSNRVVCAEGEFETGSYIQVNRAFVLTVLADRRIAPGSAGLSAHHRKWMNVAVNDQLEVIPFDPWLGIGQDHLLGAMTVEVGYLSEAKATEQLFDAEKLEKGFQQLFDSLIFRIDQPIVFAFEGHNLQGVVRSVQVLHLNASPQGAGAPDRMGVLASTTAITFTKANGSAIKLKSSAKRGPANAIIQPNFRFEDMGIGGLDNEFSNIFRRAFASRIFPPGLIEKLGIQHVKGLLLYGPPGTGKTLMARQIGKMLNAREPKIVNGPEILNKFVGQSEENIRKLFADAEKEYKAKGEDSGLHIIIFDELDAICKQRGSTGGGTGVGDSVVNQLLSKMDGVDQLNNILVIGMTNRLDMIDEALLRPGRLEVHMEISLPDEAGRLQILKIHTAKMRDNSIMGADVDLSWLASVTKNFSGAEIGGLTKSATSFAFNRHIKVGTQAGIGDDIDSMQVSKADFENALIEVKPAFGVAEAELEQVIENGIMHFDPRIAAILKDGHLLVEQVRNSERTPLVNVLVHGPAGAGKTALAATIAMASGAPFIKLVAPEDMVGFGEAQKVAYINKIFTDAYKSMLSVVVVDSIERLIDWVPIGPRFSNAVLQALLVLFTKRPPKGRRLLILATTSSPGMLADMGMSEVFAAELAVPAIGTIGALLKVVTEAQLFPENDAAGGMARLRSLLEQAGLSDDYSFLIGVKKLLGLVEMARQDQDPAETLFARLRAQMGL